ncbi:hypothetical protein DL96DRAFT_1671246 [Flagelloscypha sp. PMI_526]|nr:hypothetical protein DL96DRAFT_1671246 [Flagelloscypha sp. PMI_526]
MHVILTGATGNIGGPVLKHCLATPGITKLTILARRDTPMPTPAKPDWDTSKVQVVIHQDYLSYPPDVLEKLHGAEACIWAQGTGQGSVSQPEYIKITNEYPLAAARAFPSLSPTNKFTFAHVSGEFASQEESASSLYSNIKGRTEKQLLELAKTRASDADSPILNVFNVRPGWVDPQGNPEPSRSLWKRTFEDRVAGPLLRLGYKRIVTPAPLLARVLVDLALGDGEPLPIEAGVLDNGRTIENAVVRAWGTAEKS